MSDTTKLKRWSKENAILFATRDRDSYEFLSNFFHAPFYFAGELWPTAEHAYQAFKTNNEESREKILNARTPGGAKRLGKKVKIRPDWEEVKFSIMEDIVRSKFKDRALKNRLLRTKDKTLIEDTTWGDTTWGVDTGMVGRNWLGQILMKVRKEYGEESNQEKQIKQE